MIARTVVFRADASLQIGSGHVMRCLTMADALRARGIQCHFICRDLVGNLMDPIRDRGFSVSVLFDCPDPLPNVEDEGSGCAHAEWLPASQADDARATAALLEGPVCDWLVVDHYALAEEWERAMHPYCTRLLVIDDLADRRHDCDVLVDQNLGRAATDYVGLVPERCSLLVGTQYALLRPEFAELREYSIRRRRPSRPRRFLVSMGGVDRDNAAGKVLDALTADDLPDDCTITVVMGLHAPWLQMVKAKAAAMPWRCDVRINVSDMAKLLADSDRVIGAAGGTSWERCCLGAPSIIVVLADNQRPGAAALDAAGSAYLLGAVDDIPDRLSVAIRSLTAGDKLQDMSGCSATICDGRGLSRVLHRMYPEESTKIGPMELCCVRPMETGDLERVLCWRNSAEVRRYMYNQHIISESEHHAWFKRASADPKRHMLIVEEAGRPLGFVQFTRAEGSDVAVWGFYTVPDSPKGTGRKMARAALDHAFGPLKIGKVCGESVGFNEGSIAFHRALGFTEGEVLSRQYFDGVRYHAIHRFAMLAEEWRYKRET